MPLLVYYPRHAVQNSASHVGIGPLCCYPGSISSSCKGMERCDRKWRLWEMVAGVASYTHFLDGRYLHVSVSPTLPSQQVTLVVVILVRTESLVCPDSP